MNLKDCRIEFYKSGGPGGQHKNKRFMAVRITHLPTGLVAVSQEFRSQAVNKEVAYERLKGKLEKLNKPKVPRVATKSTRSSRERTLAWKKKRGEKKKSRLKRFNMEE